MKLESYHNKLRTIAEILAVACYVSVVIGFYVVLRNNFEYVIIRSQKTFITILIAILVFRVIAIITLRRRYFSNRQLGWWFLLDISPLML